MSFSHVSLPVGNHYIAMRNFYTAALKPLRYEILIGDGEGQQFVGLGTKSTGPHFWLGLGANNKSLPKYDGILKNRLAPFHVAFNATSVEQVDEWYKAAMEAGGIDNGKPGKRQYSVTFYAAFVLDPLGNNIEVLYGPLKE
ncbi:hypothetical protein S7711_10053 [Stachybotrys chartarum IBT 7711]|uniref:VOC domain-containing protein n=1 Tax=Stachybotrys chartarum (strain CBS 109288 / IBT 7711) TaxID=1280523 RepID=A0A084AZS6_STACB|nr:hypothetical protein S7711_10053 [Stachybotrys chartarum IBT 7711]KFA51956.1 hypothetical protein S40293_09488 [Stachybotrys chartarum IBT 40293]KFA80287.1 hypothetical protein S40288_10000 [Stachybotrys chartarum IBT 40288]